MKQDNNNTNKYMGNLVYTSSSLQLQYWVYCVYWVSCCSASLQQVSEERVLHIHFLAPS